MTRVVALLAAGSALVVTTAITDGTRVGVATTQTERTLVIAIALAAVVVGSVLVRERTTARLGLATWLVGALALAPQWAGLDGADDTARSTATALAPLLPVALFHAAFSVGADRGAWLRRMVGPAWTAGVVLCAARAVTLDPTLDPNCSQNCVVNDLRVTGSVTIAQGAARLLVYLALACALGAVVAAVWSLRTATGLAALAATGAAAAAVAVALAGLTSARFDPATAIERTAAVLVTLALAALALAGAAIATRPTRRLRAVERIVAGSDSWGGLEARLRRTLGDAGLTIAYPLDDGRLVDAEGRPVDDESFHAVRHVTTISGPAGPLARVAHAHRLVGFDRRLGAAVRLTIDNERLNAALNDELRRLLLLRQRIVAAGERERRRIERNLHDGAQQHLVALILELGLAPYDPELAPLAPELAHVAATIDGALADLREVARGLYPAVLDGAGLGGAIADLARRAATPVVFTGNLDAHLPRVIEEAVYVAVREGLANVDAHAAASRATIDLRHTEEAVLTSVRDDGRGGAVIGDTGGLAELGDRVGALRGSVRVVDRPGKGTILEVRIPCE